MRYQNSESQYTLSNNAVVMLSLIIVYLQLHKPEDTFHLLNLDLNIFFKQLMKNLLLFTFIYNPFLKFT